MAVTEPGAGGQHPGDRSKPSWTFLTNHGHVLVCIAKDPGIRGRDIAERVGITERAAQSIVADLVAAGYVTRERVGRRNSYIIDPDLPVRHPVEQPHRIGDLLAAVADFGTRGPRAPRASSARTATARPRARRGGAATRGQGGDRT
jgi:hypothetical protein